jgi:hypothetical protein
MIRISLVLVAAVGTLALAGCSTLSNQFRNELAVVPGTQELRFISFYGPVGIAAKIDNPAAAASAAATRIGGAK